MFYNEEIDLGSYLYKNISSKISCIIQLISYCIATWYAMSRSLPKLTEIGTSWGHGIPVTQKPINTVSNNHYELYAQKVKFAFFQQFCINLVTCVSMI